MASAAAADVSSPSEEMDVELPLAPFELLPLECLVHLLTLSPMADAVALGSSCRAWRCIWDDDALWQELLARVWQVQGVRQAPGVAKATFRKHLLQYKQLDSTVLCCTPADSYLSEYSRTMRLSPLLTTRLNESYRQELWWTGRVHGWDNGHWTVSFDTDSDKDAQPVVVETQCLRPLMSWSHQNKTWHQPNEE